VHGACCAGVGWASEPVWKDVENLAATGFKPQTVQSVARNCIVCAISSATTIYFPMPQQPLVGQGILLFEALQLHTGTPHLVGLLWISDQPYSETSNWQHTTLAKSMSAAGFEASIPASGRWQNHVLDRAATGIDNYYIQ